MRRFTKIFTFVLFLFILFNGNSYSDVVKKVEVKGNNRISIETIMVFGDISVGKDYNIADVNSLIKKLYSTLFFSDISASIKNNKIKLNIFLNLCIKFILHTY